MSHDPRTTTNVLKVSANGNDTYPNEYGYATIGAALAVASAGDKVEVAAGGYAENITIPADVEVDAGGAILTGTITVNDGSRITLLRQNALTATTGASLTGASAIAYVAIARQDCAGTAVGAVCLTASAHLHFGVRQQTLSTGYGVGPTTAGYVHLGIEHMEINGAGTGLAATTNGRLHGFVGGIIDGGAAEGIRLVGSAIADLTIGHVETDTALHLDDTASANLTVGNVTGATTAYDVAVGATLNLVTSSLGGATVGTANVTQAGVAPLHAPTHDVGGGDEMTDISGAITVNGGPNTLAEVLLNTTHLGSTGVDHGYIDQDVTGGSDANFSMAGFRATQTAVTTPGAAAALTTHSYYLDASGGVVDLTLMTAVGNAGKRFEILAVDISNATTVTPDGVEVIYDVGGVAHSPYTYAAQYESITIEAYDGNWYIK